MELPIQIGRAEAARPRAKVGTAAPNRPRAEVGTAAPNRPRVQTGRAPACRPRGRRGFTFVEMMVVISIIVILVSMAIPVYQKSIIRAKESVLKNNLFTMRTVIDNYTYDKQKAPQTLQDLVSEGYLRDVPIDPIAGSNQSWRLIMEDATQSVDQSEPGIFDVRSTSSKVGLDGRPYSEW